MSALVGGGGPGVNKFEQVSINGHQMSLAEEGWSLSSKVPCLGGGGRTAKGSVSSEVPYVWGLRGQGQGTSIVMSNGIISKGHMG